MDGQASPGVLLVLCCGATAHRACELRMFEKIREFRLFHSCGKVRAKW
jgi:hypothetical protein